MVTHIPILLMVNRPCMHSWPWEPSGSPDRRIAFKICFCVNFTNNRLSLPGAMTLKSELQICKPIQPHGFQVIWNYNAFSAHVLIYFFWLLKLFYDCFKAKEFQCPVLWGCALLVFLTREMWSPCFKDDSVQEQGKSLDAASTKLWGGHVHRPAAASIQSPFLFS